jgi:two-component system, OmpR family, response regulator
MRVLVVDDEVRFAQSLQRGLRAEGFDVDLAHDGETGLRMARAGGYDAVVLDIMLPRLSGYRITERLRADGCDVPVLMLSAKDGEYDQADGLDLGADDYLTKPFAWVVFVARLKALLRRATGRGQAAQEEPVSAGDLVLDPAAHTVTRAGTSVGLTAREFDLLEHLMRAHGRTVPKTELLSAVWGGLAHDDPNVVEVYVGYLRRKIDQPFGRHSLMTVRGVGYRLVPDEPDEPDGRPGEPAVERDGPDPSGT